MKDEREGLGKVVGMIYGVISFGGEVIWGFDAFFCCSLLLILLLRDLVIFPLLFKL